MPSITTEIEIAAPPDAVWAVLVDYDRYSEWNPFISKLSGDKKGQFVSFENPGSRISPEVKEKVQ